MSLLRRRSVAFVLACAAIAASAVGATIGRPVRDGGGVRRASPSPSPSFGDPLRALFSERFEPFAYRPAPPLRATEIDGYYLRIVTLAELGGPEVGVPMHCRRCVPFEIDPGVETLTLYRGRYFLEHQLTGRRGLGHYSVDGRRVRFFNDPNCSGTVGVYRWAEEDPRLSFDVVLDPCPFGTPRDRADHRARDLTYSSWTRIDPCTSQIRSWWPALFGCELQGSGAP